MRLTRLGKLLRLAVAVAIEDREIDLALNQAGSLHAADAAAELADVAVEAEPGIETGAAGALLLDQALALAGQREIIGARLQRRRQKRLRLGLRQDLIAQRLGKLQRRAGAHAEVARQSEQRLLQLVLGHQQCLLVVGKLHLGAQHVNTGRRAGIMLVCGQLEQRARIRDARLRGLDAGRGRLRIQIETGNGANDQIARIPLIHLARIERVLAGLQARDSFRDRSRSAGHRC